MAASEGDALGLYFSIPFCRSKCTYCNFASGVYPASEHARYVERLIEDVARSGAWAVEMGVELPRRVDSVYLGGGTPSLLAPALLTRLFAAMRTEFDLAPDAEITVECAPGQLAEETLEALTAAGMNRVSLGVQSFIDREAAVSGRLHNRTIVFEEIERLRAAGIANFSVDLIAGLAGQTFASWQESLAILIDTGVPHASIYMLEVDEDSRLGREMLSGGARYHAGLVPTDDAIARMYGMAIDALGKSGIEQYEISNFCRPGFASRHNLRYWQRRPYLGLGLDASSMLREALPAENAESIDALKGHGLSRAEPRPKDTAALAAGEMQTIEQRFPQGLTPETPDHAKMARLKPSPFKAGELAASSGCSAAGPPGHVLRCTTASDLKSYFENRDSEESTWLSPSQQHEEAWFLGLRLNAGVEVGALEQEFGAERIAPALEVVKRLAEDGLLIFDGGKVWLTPRGQLLSNDVFQEFLGITGEEAMASRKARA